MRLFLFGVLVTLIVLALAAMLVLRLGLADPRADVPVGHTEAGIMMPAMDAAVARHAPELANPVPPTVTNLTAGMQTYQQHCALCHGDVAHRQAPLAQSLYPRPPQFLAEPADMPDHENFYIIQHGVRLTGMPGWTGLLSVAQMWELVTFLRQMDKLPPAVAAQWPALAAGGPG